MKKKRKHTELQSEPVVEAPAEQTAVIDQQDEPVLADNTFVERRQKKFKTVYSRVSVDPSKRYQTPESRESWGPNVKGKKFRKEKGKKKRCGNAGIRIDGSVKSTRLDL